MHRGSPYLGTSSQGSNSEPSQIQEPRSKSWTEIQQSKVFTSKNKVTINPERMCYETALLFYNHSKTLKTCFLTITHTEEVEAFVKLPFSKRCKTLSTCRYVCGFIKEYYEFSMNAETVTPMTGENAIVPIARWLAHLALRGSSVPRMGKYALRVFGEALGIEFPIDHPSICAAARTVKTKPTKHAPPVPVEFIKKLEETTENTEFSQAKRLFCALVLLQIYASLRFADAQQASRCLRPTRPFVVFRQI